MAQKTVSGGYQFWVVGNRTVKGETLSTDVIIAEIAEHYGMEYVYTIQRNIVNKVMPSLNSPTNETGKKSTTMTNEHILVLRKKIKNCGDCSPQFFILWILCDARKIKLSCGLS